MKNAAIRMDKRQFIVLSIARALIIFSSTFIIPFIAACKTGDGNIMSLSNQLLMI